jgi:hypothetical protein
MAILKAANFRSEGLLRKLGFTPASEDDVVRFRDEADEIVMTKVGKSRAGVKVAP